MSSDETQRVRTNIEGHVAEVVLDRAAKHNGLDVHMFEGLVAAGEALLERKDVRVVILRGEGKSFCAGLDFKSFMAGGPELRQKLLHRPEGQAANLAQRVATIWTEVPIPVIAAIHGSCIGGGLQIALGADIRIAHPESKLGVRELYWGLIPDMGITVTGRGVVRTDVLRELTYSARIVDANEAMQLGLVTRLADDPLAAARELANTIVNRAPETIRASKQMWLRAPGLDTAASLALETELQMPLLGSANQLEAVRAGMMKDTPKFKDPA